jgi:hypothetical protein
VASLEASPVVFLVVVLAVVLVVFLAVSLAAFRAFSFLLWIGPEDIRSLSAGTLAAGTLAADTLVMTNPEADMTAVSGTAVDKKAGMMDKR